MNDVDAKRKEALELRSQGLPLRTIAAKLDVGKSTVERWLKSSGAVPVVVRARDGSLNAVKMDEEAALAELDASVPEGIEGVTLLCRRMLLRMHLAIQTGQKLPYNPSQIKAILDAFRQITDWRAELHGQVAAQVAQEVSRLCEGIGDRALLKLKERLDEYAAGRA